MVPVTFKSPGSRVADVVLLALGANRVLIAVKASMDEMGSVVAANALSAVLATLLIVCVAAIKAVTCCAMLASIMVSKSAWNDCIAVKKLAGFKITPVAAVKFTLGAPAG